MKRLACVSEADTFQLEMDMDAGIAIAIPVPVPAAHESRVLGPRLGSWPEHPVGLRRGEDSNADAESHARMHAS